MPAHPPKPVLRVGITGTRAIETAPAEALEDARPRVHAILAFLKDCAHQATPASAPPALRFLSPLAEGADRLAAEEAVRLGYVLHAPLPFARDEYAKDFGCSPAYPHSIERFDALLICAAEPPPARILELDGARGDDETRSYEAVGRLVVQNCDILIGIWDGKPTNKRGGTGDMIRYAARFGPPVWWVRPGRDLPDRLIDTPFHLRRPDLARTGDDARDALRRYVEQMLRPPHAHPPHRHGAMGRCVHHLCRWRRTDRPPIEEYHAGPPPPPRTRPARAIDRLWRTFGRFMTGLGGPADPSPPPPLPAEPVEHYWHGHYIHADTQSDAFGRRYRSSYVLVFALAGLALLGAVTGLAIPKVEVLALFVEAASLLGIAALVFANLSGRWHERWIACRLLGELCRKQRVLGLLGRAIPGVEVASLGEEPDEGAAAARPRGAWVGWYFAALQRAAPLAAGPLGARELRHAAEVARGLLAEQITYHRNRERRSRAASRRLAFWGEGLFLVTLLVVIVRIVRLFLHDEAAGVDWLGLLCAALPTASAVLVGIRSYAEFEMLADESQRMLRVMRQADSAICGMDLDAPLASQDLGAEMVKVAEAMMQDVRGWAQLFRVKAVEAG